MLRRCYEETASVKFQLYAAFSSATTISCVFLYCIRPFIPVSCAVYILELPSVSTANRAAKFRALFRVPNSHILHYTTDELLRVCYFSFFFLSSVTFL